MKKSYSLKILIVLVSLIMGSLILKTTRVYGKEIETDTNKQGEVETKDLAELSKDEIEKEEEKDRDLLKEYTEELNSLEDESKLDNEKEKAQEPIKEFNGKMSDKTYSIVKWLDKQMKDNSSDTAKYFAQQKTGTRSLNGQGVNYAPNVNLSMINEGIVSSNDKVTYRIYNDYNNEFYNIFVKLDDITSYSKGSTMTGVVFYSSKDNTWFYGSTQIKEETVTCSATKLPETYNIIDGGTFEKNKVDITNIVNNYNDAKEEIKDITEKENKRTKIIEKIDEVTTEINNFEEELEKRAEEEKAEELKKLDNKENAVNEESIIETILENNEIITANVEENIVNETSNEVNNTAVLKEEIKIISNEENTNSNEKNNDEESEDVILFENETVVESKEVRNINDMKKDKRYETAKKQANGFEDKPDDEEEQR